MFTRKNNSSNLMINNELTLLVALKDRFEFTKRMCRYFSEISYPFHVIFADGSLGPETEDFFRSFDSSKFSYEYIRYSKDETLSCFYAKMLNSAKRVQTPYVMLADNDDFPISDGQLEAVKFLKENSDYIGCNGRVAGVVLSPPQKAYSSSIFFIPSYCKIMDMQIPLDQDETLERIKEYSKDFYSIFYAVFTINSLILSLEEIKKMDFDTLHVCEIFFSLRQLSQGKIKSLNTLTYVRQKGSSQSASSQKSWFFRAIHTDMISDLKKSFSYIASLINQKNEDTFPEICKAYTGAMEKRYSYDKWILLLKLIHFIEMKIVIFCVRRVSIVAPFLSYWISVLFLANITTLSNVRHIKRTCIPKKD